LRAGAIPVDRLRTVASVIADGEPFAPGTGSADFKPAQPHPMEAHPLEARTDAPAEEPPTGG